MRVFTLLDGYLPGFKHGGPIRTIANLVEQMPPGFEFLIFTRDRDRGDSRPYPGVPLNEWRRVGRANVYYASGSAQSLSNFLRQVDASTPDVVYANSLFSHMTLRALAARRIGRLRAPLLLAPRGELSRAALSIKSWKKRPFLQLARAVSLYDGLLWQASSEHEKRDIEREVPWRARKLPFPDICVAPDPISLTADVPADREKHPGSVKFIFLSRITPMKNLAYAIERLSGVRGIVALDVYGPKDDQRSWAAAERAMASLPRNATVVYRGTVQPKDVASTLAGYHFFVLPTRGENFGHVVFEALSTGCPVVLSDRTPWRSLDREGAGWVLPLESPARWTETLQRCVDMDQREFSIHVSNARRLARSAVASDGLQQNMAMFRMASSLRAK